MIGPFAVALLTVCARAHEGVFMYHTAGSDWASYDWKDTMANATLYHSFAQSDSTGNIDFGTWPNTELQAQITKARGKYVLALTGSFQDISASVDTQNTLIKNVIASVQEAHADGVNLDYEGMGPEYKETYTAFVQAFVDACHGLDLSLSLAASININGWPGGFDHLTLSRISDGLFFMGYDMNWGSQQAGPNADLPTLKEYIQASLSAGVAPSKMILGVPWYGYSYACNTTAPGTPCLTDDAWPMPSFCYGEAQKSAATWGRQWDDQSSSPFWEQPQTENGVRMQGWYADPESTQVKFTWAKQLGLRGVGTWHAGCGDGDADLWQALNSFL